MLRGCQGPKLAPLCKDHPTLPFVSQSLVHVNLFFLIWLYIYLKIYGRHFGTLYTVARDTSWQSYKYKVHPPLRAYTVQAVEPRPVKVNVQEKIWDLSRSRSTPRMFVCCSLVDRNIDGQPGFILGEESLYLAIASLLLLLVFLG